MPKPFYLLAYLIPACTYIALMSQGVWTYLAPIVAFIVLPLLEISLPKMQENYSPEQETKALNSKYFDYIVYFTVPTQIFLVLTMCYQISVNTYSGIELFGLIFSMGISCAVLGINVGHELGHRVKKSEQLMAKILLATSWYSHFFIEHNKGHHRHVSTDKDPASARVGQNVFHFWVQSLVGAFKSAVNFERKRLAKDNIKNPLANEVYRWKLIELSVTVAIGFVFGIKSALAFLGAALIGALLLECVNYIEHYGLRRKMQANGRYEKVTPHHSWNSDHPIGRLVLFDLSRHSDHHANPSRKYQILRSFKNDCPQFPTGYPGMIILSLVPPLWFKVMNKRVTAWELSKLQS